MIFDVHYNPTSRVFSIIVPDKKPVPAISEWPGWRRAPSGVYYAPAWPSSILAMKTAHLFRWDEEAAKARDEILHNLNTSRRLLSSDDRSFSLLKEAPTERQPKLHQRQAVNALRHMGWRALLADDMGLGKTSTALWAAHDADAERILVICPVSVKFNWEKEIRLTLGEHNWFVQVIDGSSKRRAQQLVEALAALKRTAIVMNYDLLRHFTEDQLRWIEKFISEKRSIALLDESHYLKSRESDRTKIASRLASKAACVIAMTGTPIRNLAEDLYSQVEIVRPGTWTSYRDFAKRHLVIRAVKFGKRETHKVVGVKNLDSLNAVMNTLQIKRAKIEVLDLPPKIHTFPELKLDGEHLRIYRAMRDFARVELSKLIEPVRKPSDVMEEHGITAFQHGSQRITGDQVDSAMGVQPVRNIFDPRARSAVEQAMRCEQLANGFIGGIPDPLMSKLGDALKLAEKIPGRPNELMFPTHPKVVWLMETIDSVLAQGGSPIVYSRFNAPLVWLGRVLTEKGVINRLFHGNLVPLDKFEAVQHFQEGHARVLLCQVKIAEGWNATRCQDVIFWTRDWSPAVNTQAEDRAHRMGQTGTVNVQIPIVRQTVEMLIHRRLAAKDADAEQALRNVTIEELMEAL